MVYSHRLLPWGKTLLRAKPFHSLQWETRFMLYPMIIALLDTMFISGHLTGIHLVLKPSRIYTRFINQHQSRAIFSFLTTGLESITKT